MKRRSRSSSSSLLALALTSAAFVGPAFVLRGQSIDGTRSDQTCAGSRCDPFPDDHPFTPPGLASPPRPQYVRALQRAILPPAQAGAAWRLTLLKVARESSVANLGEELFATGDSMFLVVHLRLDNTAAEALTLNVDLRKLAVVDARDRSYLSEGIGIGEGLPLLYGSLLLS